MKARIPGGAGGNMNALLKQAQKAQEDMARLKEELDSREYSAASGGGLVEVTVTGAHRVQRIKINPEAIDPDDSEMLEDFLTIALNEAIDNAKKAEDAEMAAIAGGLNIPGVF